MKKICLFVLACAFVLSLASCGKKENTGSIKIGLSGPLTGGAASYGLAVVNSAEMAIKEINEAGGLNGIKFELTAYDDQLKADLAATNYATLYDGGMQISLGCVTSGACIEYGKYAKEDKVFCLTPSATSDQVPVIGDNMYQMCFSDSGQGTGSALYITEFYPNAKLGIFYDSSDAYSKGIYDTFKAAYKGNIIAEASFTDASKTDFAGQVSQLKDCDLIFMPIYYSEAALFIDQAKDTIAKDAVYFGCDGLDGIESVKGFDANAYAQEISYLSHFNSGSKEETTVEYVEKYTKAYGVDTLNQFGASAYDCVYAIYNALKLNEGKVKASLTAEEFYNILAETFQNGFTFNGVTGKNITWNKDGTVSKTPTKYVVNPNRTKA